jgi:hypothetical protein
MAARIYKLLNFIAFNPNGIAGQHYELSKQLQDLLIYATLLSATHLKSHERYFIPNHHV